MIVDRSRPKPKAVAALALGACLMASVVLFDERSFLPRSDNGGDDGAHPIAPRRHLKSRGSPLHPWEWAHRNLLPLTSTPDPSRETIVFWHIPKSGGTTVKSIYTSVAMRKKMYIAPNQSKILKAKEWGLLEPGRFDIIFTSFPEFAIEQMSDSRLRGRVLALFRHPVERLISKFYYLRSATWERNYNPKWKKVTILDWAKGINRDNNHMVKKLAGKVQRDEATERDLRKAMKTVRQRFVVGLTDEMEESIHRFNAIMGVDEEDELTKRVMFTFFGEGKSKNKKINSHSHPKVKEGSPAWNLLAEQNALDVRLYEYILVVFREQKELIDSYRTSFAANRVSEER